MEWIKREEQRLIEERTYRSKAKRKAPRTWELLRDSVAETVEYINNSQEIQQNYGTTINFSYTAERFNIESQVGNTTKRLFVILVPYTHLETTWLTASSRDQSWYTDKSEIFSFGLDEQGNGCFAAKDDRLISIEEMNEHLLKPFLTYRDE